MVQWFELHTSSARGMDLIPGTKTPHAMWHGKNKNQQNKKEKNMATTLKGDPKAPTRLFYILFLLNLLNSHVIAPSDRWKLRAGELEQGHMIN